MNKKKLIQIVIIVCAFGGSGIVLYNGFFKTSKPPAINSAILSNMAGGALGPNLPGANLPNGGDIVSAAPIKNINQILPNGETLNLDIVRRPNVAYDTLSLPKVNPKQEVGIDKSLLIVPLPKPANPVSGQPSTGGLLQIP